MHDGYELCVFFDSATVEQKTDVLLELCKDQPDLLLEVVRRVTNEPWKSECKALVRRGDLIPAIKLWRAETAAGLKEAKDAVEAL